MKCRLLTYGSQTATDLTVPMLELQIHRSDLEWLQWLHKWDPRGPIFPGLGM